MSSEITMESSGQEVKTPDFQDLFCYLQVLHIKALLHLNGVFLSWTSRFRLSSKKGNMQEEK